MYKLLKKLEVLYEANLFTIEGNLKFLKSEGDLRDDGRSFFFHTQVGGPVSIQWDDSRCKAQRVHSFMRDNVDHMDSFFWDKFFIMKTKLFYVDGDDDVDDDDDDEAKHPRDDDDDDDDDGIDENQTLNDLRKEAAKKAAGVKKPKVAMKVKKSKVVLKSSEKKGAFQEVTCKDGKTRKVFNPYAKK